MHRIQTWSELEIHNPVLINIHGGSQPCPNFSFSSGDVIPNYSSEVGINTELDNNALYVIKVLNKCFQSCRLDKYVNCNIEVQLMVMQHNET